MGETTHKENFSSKSNGKVSQSLMCSHKIDINFSSLISFQWQKNQLLISNHLTILRTSGVRTFFSRSSVVVTVTTAETVARQHLHKLVPRMMIEGHRTGLEAWPIPRLLGLGVLGFLHQGLKRECWWWFGLPGTYCLLFLPQGALCKVSACQR